jgi:sugar phosphate isomerase/epimerase
MTWTRRDLGRTALLAVPALFISDRKGGTAAQSRPDSVVNGVTIGMNVPYNFGGRNAPIGEIIGGCVQLGISGVELRAQPVESALGAPAHLVPMGRGAGRGGRGAAADPEAARRAAEELRQWRSSVATAKVAGVRRQFEDAGIKVEILKVDGILTMSDAEIDYAFGLAKGLGARAISTEIAHDGTERLGQFADRHRLMVGYHGHGSTTEADFERVFGQATHNGANLDIGHFVAGQNASPVPFLKRHHGRITHIHVKDRKLKNGPNVPFGQGDTPIREVLQLIRDNRWPIQATIEFEYPIPEGSDRMAELRKAIDYCRAALA